jgi:hypothetical protein
MIFSAKLAALKGMKFHEFAVDRVSVTTTIEND